MSRDDFDAGLRGLGSGPNSDTRDYAAGRAVFDNIEQQKQNDALAKGKSTAMPTAPKVEVSGAAMGAIPFLPLLYIAYPVGGLLNLSVILLAIGIGEFALGLERGSQLALALVAALVALIPALKAERFVNKFGPYRLLRHIFRVVVFGLIMFAVVNSGAPLTGGIYTPEYQIPYVALFWAAVTMVGAHYLMLFFDKLLFPVPSQKQGRFSKAPEEKLPPYPIRFPHIVGAVFIILMLILFAPVINPAYPLVLIIGLAGFMMQRRRKKMLANSKLMRSGTSAQGTNKNSAEIFEPGGPEVSRRRTL